MSSDEQLHVDCPPVDLERTLGPLGKGSGDPTTAANASGWWWATRTPDGPATVQIAASADRNGLAESVRARSWGPGASAVLDRIPGLIGADDPLEEFRPDDDRVKRLLRERPGARMGRTSAVFETLLPTVLGQLVIGKEAKRSYRRLVAKHGEDAPGPPGLRLAPSADVVGELAYHEWHPLGVERRRAQVVQRCAREAERLESTARRPEALRRRLDSLAGVGPWTIANVMITCLGDPDAVIVGDYNIPSTVAWVLADEAEADDARMLELLEPFEGHRARVQRLAKFSGSRPPRRGPKLAFREIDRQ